MKQENTFRYLLRLTVVLLLITAVVAGMLGAVNAVTKDRIAALNEEKQRTAMAAVLEAESYDALALPVGCDGTVAAAYRASVSGETVGYVIEVLPAGFGGPVDLMVGVDTDLVVTGVSVISHSETSGLGAVAAQKNAKGIAFRDQFIGESGTLSVTKDGGTVDALTGATITSRAVTDGVNAALSCAELLTEGGGAQ